jgi:hypothetical protein
MKKYFKVFAGIAVVALIISGCSPLSYVQNDNSHHNPAYGYYYGDDYGYDLSPVDYNNQGYQYSQPAGVAVSQPPVGFNDFYNQLSPYGTWINMQHYGQVWVANVPNFQPYSTNGYWAYTTYGWTWVSNYAWGWAPFHYGRWDYNSRYGWFWVPGYVWGPAWVAWSSSADMYGWAPLRPGMNFSVNLSIDLFPSSYWTFMPGRYMGNNNIGNYYVNRSRNVTIIKNTTIINNYGTENNRRYSMGPNAADVQRHTNRNIQPMRINNTTDSRSVGVGNNELHVYRPVTRTEATPSRETSAPGNNRTTTPQTRTQPAQPTTRTSEPQTRTQSTQPATRTTTPQTRSQSTQPAATNNRAAPQTTKQIQNAQNDNRRMQQPSSSTPTRR